MNSKKMIRKLSTENAFKNSVSNIIKVMNLSSDKVIDLIEIPYSLVKDSEEYTFVINQEIYDYLLKSNKSCILLGKTVQHFRQEFIYINNVMQDYGAFLEENNEYDTCILYQPREEIKNTTLEQDQVLDYCTSNKDTLNLRDRNMNLTVKDIKDLINFGGDFFYDTDIKVFSLIRNGNELNIIYNENGIIKDIVNIYLSNKDYNDFIPVKTYFNSRNNVEYKKRKV